MALKEAMEIKTALRGFGKRSSSKILFDKEWFLVDLMKLAISLQ